MQQKGEYFDEAEIYDIFAQVCLGVKHCHENKVLHRDIKSQNIFLTQTGLVKLGDFGASRIIELSRDLADTIIGTKYAMAPELHSGEKYRFKSDIWSLGVLLQELATLVLPWVDPKTRELIDLI